MEYLDELHKKVEKIMNEYDELSEQWEEINRIYDEINRVSEEKLIPIGYFKPVLNRLDEMEKVLKEKESLLKKKTKRFTELNKIKSRNEKMK